MLPVDVVPDGGEQYKKVVKVKDQVSCISVSYTSEAIILITINLFESITGLALFRVLHEQA